MLYLRGNQSSGGEYIPPWGTEIVYEYSEPEVLSVPSYKFFHLASNDTTGDVYLTIKSGGSTSGIYKITNEDLSTLTRVSTTARPYHDIMIDQDNGDVYATSSDSSYFPTDYYSYGLIYKQTGGTGEFSALSIDRKLWRKIIKTSTGRILASTRSFYSIESENSRIVGGVYDIYPTLSFIGPTILREPPFEEELYYGDFDCLCEDNSGNLFVGESQILGWQSESNIYKSTSGTGDFTNQHVSSNGWESFESVGSKTYGFREYGTIIYIYKTEDSSSWELLDTIDPVNNGYDLNLSTCKDANNNIIIVGNMAGCYRLDTATNRIDSLGLINNYYLDCVRMKSGDILISYLNGLIKIKATQL